MWAFGVFNSGANFLLNFKDGWSIRSYLIVSAITGYLPLTFGQILLFLKAELRWKVCAGIVFPVYECAAAALSCAFVAAALLRFFCIFGDCCCRCENGLCRSYQLTGCDRQTRMNHAARNSHRSWCASCSVEEFSPVTFYSPKCSWGLVSKTWYPWSAPLQPQR